VENGEIALEKFKCATFDLVIIKRAAITFNIYVLQVSKQFSRSWRRMGRAILMSPLSPN